MIVKMICNNFFTPFQVTISPFPKLLTFLSVSISPFLFTLILTFYRSWTGKRQEYVYKQNPFSLFFFILSLFYYDSYPCTFAVKICIPVFLCVFVYLFLSLVKKKKRKDSEKETPFSVYYDNLSFCHFYPFLSSEKGLDRCKFWYTSLLPFLFMEKVNICLYFILIY
jgi:hypothetical protein